MASELPDTEQEVVEGKEHSKWYWIGLVFKYGSAVLIAIVSVYAARQDKAQEALEKLHAAYQEHSVKIVELQTYAKEHEDEKKAVLAECKSLADKTSENALFYLIGKEGRTQLQGARKGGLAEALNNLTSKLEKGSYSYPKKKLMLKKPRQFNKLEQRATDAPGFLR